MSTKTFKLTDLFTRQELEAAVRLYRAIPPPMFATACAEQIVAPVIKRINEVTGQENSTLYFAYAIEAAIGEASK